MATYVAAQHEGEVLILAEANCWPRNLGEDAVCAPHASKAPSCPAFHYEPLYRGLPGGGRNHRSWDDAYRVVADDYVSLEDGTGVVHTAPAYGDLEIGRRHGLPTLFSVDLTGSMMALPDLRDLEGQLLQGSGSRNHPRPERPRGLLLPQWSGEAHLPVLLALPDAPLLFLRQVELVHPHHRPQGATAARQRCHPLGTRRTSSDGRFGNWLENNIDWAISRRALLGHAAAHLGMRVRPTAVHRQRSGAGREGRQGPVGARPSPALCRRDHLGMFRSAAAR